MTEDLAMRKMCAMLVPQVLLKEQNANQKAICQDLLHHVNEDSEFLENIVFDDDTWVFKYDPESKR